MVHLLARGVSEGREGRGRGERANGRMRQKKREERAGREGKRGLDRSVTGRCDFLLSEVGKKE